MTTSEECIISFAERLVRMYQAMEESGCPKPIYVFSKTRTGAVQVRLLLSEYPKLNFVSQWESKS